MEFFKRIMKIFGNQNSLYKKESMILYSMVQLRKIKEIKYVLLNKFL